MICLYHGACRAAGPLGVVGSTGAHERRPHVAKPAVVRRSTRGYEKLYTSAIARKSSKNESSDPLLRLRVYVSVAIACYSGGKNVHIPMVRECVQRWTWRATRATGKRAMVYMSL